MAAAPADLASLARRQSGVLSGRQLRETVTRTGLARLIEHATVVPLWRGFYSVPSCLPKRAPRQLVVDDPGANARAQADESKRATLEMRLSAADLTLGRQVCPVCTPPPRSSDSM